MAEYVLPVGLQFDPPTPSPAEGYEVEWQDDEDPPHYAFCAQVSALRVERLFRDAIDCLPPYVHAVLEVRRPDQEMDEDPEGPTHLRWASGMVHREEVDRILTRYAFQICHDGMVGFGVYDPDSALEVLLDDHKLLNLFSPRLDPFERLLKRHRVPCADRIEAMVEAPHEHFTLRDIPFQRATPMPHYLSRRRFDVDWFAEAIRRRLRMRPTPHPIED